jgi:pimeloyl-ACP methyl ester carboxylesterase
MNYDQRALHFACQGSSLVGIIDVPERPIARGVLVLGGRTHYRSGSHRQYTLLARLLAPRGIPVMRFDRRGTGDSDGLPDQAASVADDIHAAIREFSLQVPAMQEIVIWALGDAATDAALFAPTEARVRGLVLLNPECGPDSTPPAPVRSGEIGFWKRVGSRADAACDADLPLAQRLMASLARFNGTALVVVGGADTVGLAFADLMDRNDSALRRVTIMGANHGFTSRAWRDEVAELSANWIVSW